tara:strand:- start:24 stop:218 length:195 start_codon:yes stop_codon:yes gene_type:complete
MSKLKDQVSGWVIDKIQDPEVKDKVVKKWNSAVNIPIIGEDTESKILSAIYDSVVEVIEDVLKK